MNKIKNNKIKSEKIKREVDELKILNENKFNEGNIKSLNFIKTTWQNFTNTE